MTTRRFARPTFQLGVAPNQLREILRDLTRWALASSVTAAAGCAADHPGSDLGQSVPPGSDVSIAGGGGSPTPRAGKWKPLDCSKGSVPSVLVHVKFNDPFDYVALYRSFASGVAMTGPFPAGVSLVEELGRACSGASEQDACNKSLIEARTASDACTTQGRCAPFLLTTDQQGAKRSDERSALLAQLGAIDNEHKAALVAAFDDHMLSCPFTPTPDNWVQGKTPLRGTETRSIAGGYDVRTEWQAGCAAPAFAESVHVDKDGTLQVIEPQHMLAPSSCIAGRRPQGLCVALPTRRGSALGMFFAEAARLEAASVHAFARLARELAALGAPAQFIARAVQAGLDELQHTHVTGELARRFGAEPLAARIAPPGERSSVAMAIENAVEGCVRETYGALLAHHQAQSAHDPYVRAAMSQIAEDETRHAQLSWEIAHWLEPRLPQAARRAIRTARAAALAQLAAELSSGFTLGERRAIGWPTPELAALMLERLGVSLDMAQA